ncbi:NOL1/NOP2/sun family putative RNA methylase [Aliikangiella maris]|uniref:NOL1/NOP2/sun family putative RNA methylase n=2 Tax=Aliikangiella maris TaxID=3162458 RepID=A0ABV3MLN6_9GAMM
MSDIKNAANLKISESYLIHARQTFLSAESEAEFLAACARPLRPSIRINSLKWDYAGLVKAAQQYGWQITPIPWCEAGYWVAGTEDCELSLGNCIEHIQGLFYIQEASSMLPPVALLLPVLNWPAEDNHRHSWLVADVAAAPGSKTTQMAAMLENQGLVLANELSASRLKSLHANLVRCGVTNTVMSHLDGCDLGEKLTAQFDFILLDAPCSGEGTVRKDPLALADWQLTRVQTTAQLQKRLITSAYEALKPGGILVYSTCTLSLEENHQVVDSLLDTSDAQVESLHDLFHGAEKAVTQQGYLHILPHHFDSEGFFVAKVRKPKTASGDSTIRPVFQSPFKPINKKQWQPLHTYYQQHFGFDLATLPFDFLQRDKSQGRQKGIEVWLFPKQIERLNAYIKINRAGIHLADVFPKKIRTNHQFVMAFAAYFKQQCMTIDSNQASTFMRGASLDISVAKHQVANNAAEYLPIDGEVILMVEQKVLGIGLKQKHQIKNLLPRDLVRDNLQF